MCRGINRMSGVAINQMMKHLKGFTIIELMLTLAVLGVVLAIAVPSFGNMTTNNRMASELNEFVASLHFARSEAVKRGLDVRLCTSTDGVNCNPANDWTQGWIVRVDGPNTVIKVHAALGGGDSLIGDGNTGDAIRFDRNGFATGFNGTVKMCEPNNDLKKARGVVIAVTGRVRLAEDSNHDGIAEDGGDNNLTCP